MAKPVAVLIKGELADAGELDSSGEALIFYISGPHRGHIAQMSTAKHNCGAYEQEVRCECGNAWNAPCYGCWQYSHSYPESGDKSLDIRSGLEWSPEWRSVGILAAVLKKRLGFREAKDLLREVLEGIDYLD